MGDVVADKYAIDAVLGEGGMGVVYAATNQLTGKKVALKWMLPSVAGDEQAALRFSREARAAGSIEHPNVVGIFDVGRHDETPFLVMELLRGRSLAERMSEGPMAPGAILDVLLPAMQGLHAAHAKGIIHRDLKPENVFVCEGSAPTAKVLDFGISKAVGGEIELGSVTKTGAIVGTPHYMSPEQIRGSKDLDARTDVYSLGVILYEAITGELPFDADTFTALAIEIATAPLRPMRTLVPELDPALDAVVLRALARDREDRYPSAASLAEALAPFRSLTIAYPPTDRRARDHASTVAASLPLAPRRAARWPWAVGTCVVVLGAITLYAWPAPEATPAAPPASVSPRVERASPPEPIPAPAADEREPIANEPAPIEEPGRPAPAHRRPRRRAPEVDPGGAEHPAPAHRTGGVSIDEF